MDIKVFLWDWRWVIVLILALIIFAIFEWGKVKEMAISGALMAKKLAKDAILNSGQEQEGLGSYEILSTITASCKGSNIRSSIPKKL